MIQGGGESCITAISFETMYGIWVTDVWNETKVWWPANQTLLMLCLWISWRTNTDLKCCCGRLETTCGVLYPWCDLEKNRHTEIVFVCWNSGLQSWDAAGIPVCPGNKNCVSLNVIDFVGCLVFQCIDGFLIFALWVTSVLTCRKHPLYGWDVT